MLTHVRAVPDVLCHIQPHYATVTKTRIPLELSPDEHEIKLYNCNVFVSKILQVMSKHNWEVIVHLFCKTERSQALLGKVS